MSRWVADVDRRSECGQRAHGGRGRGVHSQVWRGRACALGCQCHALGAQKADFSAGEKEHRIAGPSAAEVQFLHHPSSVLGDGGRGGKIRRGRACPGLPSGTPGGTTLGLEARKR